VPFAKGNNGTHRTLDSAVNFGLGEEVPHLSSRTARLRGTVPRHRTPSGCLESRTKRPKRIRGLWTWSGEYQRAMRKLWELDESITRSQSNKISQLLKSIQQDQSVIKVKEPIQPAARDPQVNNNKSSRRKQRRGKPTRSKIDASRRSELGHQESPS